MMYIIKDPSGEDLYELEVVLDADYDGNPVINISNTALEYEWGDPVEILDVPLTAAEELREILGVLIKEANKQIKQNEI